MKNKKRIKKIEIERDELDYFVEGIILGFLGAIFYREIRKR